MHTRETQMISVDRIPRTFVSKCVCINPFSTVEHFQNHYIHIKKPQGCHTLILPWLLQLIQFSSSARSFNPMPPLPSAWLRQQTISWMGNLLASILISGSASILLFWARTWMSSGTRSSSSALVSAASLPLLAVSPPQCFSSPTTEHSSIHHFPVVSLDSQSSPDLPLFWSSSLFPLLCSGIKVCIQKEPQEFHGCPVIKTPLFHCPEPRAQSLVRN